MSECYSVFGNMPIDTSRNKQDEARLRPGPHVTFNCAAEIDKLEQRDKCAMLFERLVCSFLWFIANLKTASREVSLYGSFPI